ncbi:hypothetical protein [Nocardia sp. NPDC051570]|uniref:hypothetical protein n=1 Tax=Nocardia sp. NPDC051570 TaxID=3364324 RepID=UPI0037B79F85
MANIGWWLAGGPGRGLTIAAMSPEHVPVYSRTEVWIGSGILLLGLAALLIGLLLATRRGDGHHPPRHQPFRRARHRRGWPSLNQPPAKSDCFDQPRDCADDQMAASSEHPEFRSR